MRSFLFILFAFFSNFAIAESAPQGSAPSSSEVYKFFGAEKKYIGYKFITDKTFVLENYLTREYLRADLRSRIYRRSSCGVRQFQFITAKDINQQYRVVFDCEDNCLAFRDDEVTKSFSPSVKLDAAFCKSLWGGAVRLIDKNSI